MNQVCLLPQGDFYLIPFNQKRTILIVSFLRLRWLVRLFRRHFRLRWLSWWWNTHWHKGMENVESISSSLTEAHFAQTSSDFSEHTKSLSLLVHLVGLCDLERRVCIYSIILIDWSPNLKPCVQSKSPNKKLNYLESKYKAHLQMWSPNI